MEESGCRGILRVVLFDLILLIYFTCIFYLHVYPCTLFVSGTCGGQKHPLDSLEVELRIVMSHHGDAGNQTQVLQWQRVL